MAANDSEFSALDVNGEPPRLPADILDAAPEIIERNAEMFRESAPPPLPVLKSVQTTLLIRRKC